MKIFISQPMKGKTEEEIKAIRQDAIDALPKDAEVIDSFFDDFEVDETKNVPLIYLAKSIELLAEADLAVFVGDWSNARGCVVEYDCCKFYGIDTANYDPETKDLEYDKFTINLGEGR